MNIHLIGDSHTLMHKGLEPEIMTHHFGACTAYGLLNEHSETKSFQSLHNLIRSEISTLNTVFIFGFGEIDCRVLIFYKHMEYKIDLVYMVQIVVYRYFAAISYVRDLGIEVMVHGPIPAVQQGNEYNLKHYGDNSTRASINLVFNRLLREKCAKEGIMYFDACALPYLMGPHGLVPKEVLLPDLVHVDPKKVPIADDFGSWVKGMSSTIKMWNVKRGLA